MPFSVRGRALFVRVDFEWLRVCRAAVCRVSCGLQRLARKIVEQFWELGHVTFEVHSPGGWRPYLYADRRTDQ